MPISISTEPISKGWSELLQRLSFYIIFYNKCGMVMQLAKRLSKLFMNDFAYFQEIVTFKAHYIHLLSRYKAIRGLSARQGQTSS